MLLVCVPRMHCPFYFSISGFRPKFRACFGLIGLLLISWTRVAGQSDSSTPRWAFSTGKSTAILSSPAIGLDHTIYFGVEKQTTPMTGLVMAVRPDGSERWHTNTPEEIEGAPAISADGTTLYIGCADGRLYALSTADGSQKWTFDTGRVSAIYCDPAVGPDGTIYVGSTYLQTLQDSVLYAVAPDGTKRWVVSAAGSIEGAPAIATDGTLYFGAGQTVYAVAPDGTYKWTYTTAGLIYAAPAIGADGTVYIGSDGNDFVALTPDGKLKWQFPARIGAGAAIGADGSIYVGTTDGKLYALTAGGQVNPGWPITVGAGIFSIPAVRADGTIIFGSDDRAVHAVNSDGTSKWVAGVGDAVETSPAIDTDGTIYVGSSGGVMYSFVGSGSPFSQYSSWPMFSRDLLHEGLATNPVRGGRLVNLGTRGQAGPGLNLIAGFVLQGAGSKPLLLRAVGPTLSLLNVAQPLADPTLSVHVNLPFAPNYNADWETNANVSDIISTAAAVGAFSLPSGSKDAAILATATGVDAPTNYTMTIDSADGGIGVVLMEVYDTNAIEANPRLLNLSSRGHVGTGENVLIPGIVIGGGGKLRVLVRAVGPGLVQLGVSASSILNQPKLSVYDRHSNLLASNAGWTAGGLKGDLAGAASLVGAFPLPPSSSDSAMILSLDPGQYTFLASGADGGTGEALVEVYALPY